MTPAQREQLVALLQSGDDLSPEWARILFPPEKREYELVYHGKEREEDILANTLAVPLQPIRTFNHGKAGESWHNKLIFGDNLQAMKSLLEEKRAGRLCNADGTPGVRLVYIDPPFSTRQEFRGSQDQKAYQDKIAGAQFVEFLRKRLVLIRELLSDDGVIFLHLDTKKSHYAKVILDEVFGESNFRNEIIWKRQSAHSGAKQCGAIHDTIFFYSKSSTWPWNVLLTEVSEEYKAQFFDQVDKETGRRYARGDLTAAGITKDGESGKPWRGIDPSKKGRHWAYSHSALDKLDAEGKLHWPKAGIPRLKRFADEIEGVTLQDIWTDVKIIHNQSPERVGYPTQKPESLAERIIRSCSNEGDIVLDSFAGSGTTCAVSEKLGRRWIGIDCGKLAIYTIQKRLFNLKSEIGNKGKPLDAKAFTLYNAGLYDFSKLKELPWDSWRFFALQLFQCKDNPHTIGGISFDGTFKGASVYVFNHQKQKGARVTEETIQSIHEAAGSKLGSRMFIIAPSLSFDFQQDYLDIDDVRYYALRIPYSIINELHQRAFMALQQPADEMAVNDTVDAVGFDFIRTPELAYNVGLVKQKGRETKEAFIQILTFRSDAMIREPARKKENLETLSMVMLDYNYGETASISNTDVFDLDEVFYAHTIEKAGWELRFPIEKIGKQIMAVFVDIYGNEARELISAEKFGVSSTADRKEANAIKKKAPVKKKRPTATEEA